MANRVELEAASLIAASNIVGDSATPEQVAETARAILNAWNPPRDPKPRVKLSELQRKKSGTKRVGYMNE